MSEENSTIRKRFDVALSFPGEYRNFIGDVAEVLAQQLTQERVFYDNWYEAELALPNLDTYLQSIYRDEAKLIVVFLCAEYEQKQWCGLEWRAIRDLIKNKQDKAIMPVRLDRTDIPGLFSIDGYVDATNRSSIDIGKLILKRLHLNQQATMAPSNEQLPPITPSASIRPGQLAGSVTHSLPLHPLTTSTSIGKGRLAGVSSASNFDNLVKDDLSSDREVDYTRLRDLLKAGQWKEADGETAERMFEVVGRQEQGRLELEDIQNFPCTDLRAIDQLWVNYSKGRFGFSVQKKIWQQCGRPREFTHLGWEKFGKAVGWRLINKLSKDEWKIYSDLTFGTSAPVGHLPGRMNRKAWIYDVQYPFPLDKQRALENLSSSYQLKSFFSDKADVFVLLFSRLEACKL